MLSELAAMLHVFHWNSNVDFGKFQHFSVFYWKLQDKALLDSKNRAIGNLLVYVFH